MVKIIIVYAVHVQVLSTHRSIVALGLSNMLLLMVIINPGYAQDSISVKGFLGVNPIAIGELISPSQDNPLNFEISSGKSYSSYTCKIFKIDEELFNDLLDDITNVNINIIGEEISNEICGSGTDATVDYPQSFADGQYVFQAIGTDEDGIVTKTGWIFETITTSELSKKKKVEIIESKIGRYHFEPGQILVPSYNNVLRFEYESLFDNLDFKCSIIKIEEQAFFGMMDNLLQNKTLAMGDTIIFSTKCGHGFYGAKEYKQFIPDGFYIFQVNGTKDGRLIGTDMIPFEVLR